MGKNENLKRKSNEKVCGEEKVARFWENKLFVFT